MLGLMHNALEGKGYRVDSCEDGQSAFEKHSKERYKLIITDHTMQGMTGVELINAIRSRLDHTPIILMTSYDLNELITPEQNLERVDFLRKPFGLSDLYSAVRNAIQAP